MPRMEAPGRVDVEHPAFEVGGEDSCTHRANDVLGQGDKLLGPFGLLLEHGVGPPQRWVR